jgi:hypothetical protein
MLLSHLCLSFPSGLRVFSNGGYKIPRNCKHRKIFLYKLNISWKQFIFLNLGVSKIIWNDDIPTPQGQSHVTWHSLLSASYCHVFGWLRCWFALVIGFINNLQVITTNNYYTLADLQNLQSLHTNFSVYFYKPSLSASCKWIYKMGTIKVSLNYTLPIPMHYSTHKVFKLHCKSSQVDKLFVAVSYQDLRTQNWIAVPIVFKITPLQGPNGKHRLPLL